MYNCHKKSTVMCHIAFMLSDLTRMSEHPDFEDVIGITYKQSVEGPMVDVSNKCTSMDREESKND